MEGRIKFLGTAGARYVMATQLRSSAGTLIELNGKRIILDPGPGTLVRMAKSRPRINPSSIDAVILTHLHLDHTGDANAVLDAMTEGAKKNHGKLFAPSECIEGEDRVICNYLLKAVEVVKLQPQRTYSVDGLEFSTSVPHDHGVETYGIKFSYQGKKICFMVDTFLSHRVKESYRDCDILIMNVVLVDCIEGIKHLCVDNVREVARDLRPKEIIMTHFGMGMLRVKPWELAERLSDETGIRVRAASDGMEIKL